MIEDKFGAELLGLQLPVSSLGRLPPLQAAEALLCLHPALLKFPTLLSVPPPGHTALGLGGLGSPWPSPHPVPSPPPSSHTSPPLPSPASGPAEVLSSSPKLEPPPSPHSTRKKHRRKKSSGTPRPDGPSSAAEG